MTTTTAPALAVIPPAVFSATLRNRARRIVKDDSQMFVCNDSTVFVQQGDGESDTFVPVSMGYFG